MEVVEEKVYPRQIATYLDREHYEELERRAQAEGISLAAYMRRLVIRDLAP